MATVTLDTTLIKISLDELLEKVQAAINWIPEQPTITIAIPEPYDHVVGPGPHTRGHPGRG